MMKLVSVKAENFGPFVEAGLRLDDRGLLLVQGDNQLSSSADSNGSGKSSLLEAILWANFGRTMRYDLRGKPTGDEYVNNRFGPTPGKNCRVTCTWDIDGRKVEILRTRKDKALKNVVMVSVDGNDMTRGTMKETDRLIEELLGLDFNAFVRSVYFDGSKIVPFPTLTDKEIKDVFERVLGLDDLSKVAQVVKDKLRLANANLSGVQNDLRLAQAQHSTALVEQQVAEGRQATFEAERAAEVEQAEREIATLAGTSQRDAAAIQADDDALAAREAEAHAKLGKLQRLDDAIAQWSNDHAAAQSSRATAAATLNHLRAQNPVPPTALLMERQQIAGEMDRLAREIGRVQHDIQHAEGRVGTACSECGKPVEQGDVEGFVAAQKGRLNDLGRQHADLKPKLADVDARIAADEQTQRQAIAARIATAEGELGAANARLTALGETKAKLDSFATLRTDMQRVLAELSGARSRLADERHAAERANASIEALRARIADVRAKPNPYVEDAGRWKTRMDELAAQMTGLEERAAGYEKEIGQLKVLDDAYGRTGLKAHILETVTPVLNDRANDYAQRLADGKVKIEFATVTRLKDGTLAERFSVNVENDEGAGAYHGQSSGESRKIDLAIALAMSDLVAARASKPIDLFVADEIAESLDPTAVERVVGLLQDKAKERGTILCISHADMRDLIPDIVTVQKTAAGSQIIDGAITGGW
ncbi:SMC family ATPase [Azospirillum sp. Sh1]|uniref:AAA family ATPase n=1 Tax=Azospirillum sp. Sh1 TaxID=2607285 RepID=UPI0011EEFE2A|nr:SMC family ATPase [Azospirillum sp. Sh1]KAA0573432.1 SMC family ATPase [Azospirillum sp. Sh1]